MFSFFQKKTPLTTLFPSDFVDIHSHFLPNIDDGSKGMDESVAMLKRMQGYGIKHIICTPHVMESVWENSSEAIQRKLDALNAHLKSIAFTDITVSAAAEYMLDANFAHLLKTEKLRTLKDNYILVELSFLSAPVNLYETLFNIQIAGYKPVLAHPERYSYFHNDFSAYTKLKDAFRNHEVEKTYHALVQGHMDPSSGTIDAPIDRHPKEDHRFAVVATGKESITHYGVIEYYRSVSLVKVELETGRTHQIRVHFSAFRHPLVGDTMYGADPKLAAKVQLDRQWLHAKKLSFVHPTKGETVEFESEYPADLAKALDILRGY